MKHVRSIGKASALAALLAGCMPAQAPLADATSRGDFSAGLISSDSDTQPSGPPDACWAKDDIPAVIDAITEQTVLTPEIRDEFGALIQPTVYASATDQTLVHPGGTVWFQTPCPDLIDEAFVATLQRALMARGFYLQPVTGKMDAATSAAIRTFQAQRRLDSDILSLAAARELGLIEVPRAAL
jgi:Putative peptidoglycan binding domain